MAIYHNINQGKRKMTDKKHELPDFIKDLARDVLRPPLLHGCGYTTEDLEKPRIGIANTWTDLNPGHIHLNSIADAVISGVRGAGMTPFGFNTIAPCDGLGEAHEGMRYILPSRDIIAASIEIMAKVNQLEGMVLIGSCDKIVPALLMAAARVNVPSIIITGGYHPPFCYSDPSFPEETEFAFPEIGKFVSAQMNGKISQDELKSVIRNIISGPGACPELGTAMTMQGMTEALGMSLPMSSILPGTSSEKMDFAFKTGEALRNLVDNNIMPSDIMTLNSFKNAITVLMSIGGSTNAILHLPAIAHELDVELPLGLFDELSTKTPQICNVKPNGTRAINALMESGGMPAVMKNLGGLLYGDVKTVTGKTLDEDLADIAITDSDVIRPADRPFAPDGGILVLKGNLCPEGSIIKKSAIPGSATYFKGPARVFDSEEDAIDNMLNQTVKSGDCVVIRYEGPIGGPGMREMSVSGHIMQLIELGETCAMITDGRFSGTNYGFLAGHLVPEAAAGGLLAIVEDGDTIEIDVIKKTIDLDIPKEVIEKRFLKWKAHGQEYKKGVLSWYSGIVSSSDKGAVLGPE